VDFKYKLAVAFGIFGLLILTVYAVQWAYVSQQANIVTGNYHLDETFTQTNFLYGPQAWVPYASKMTVMPGLDANANGNFYAMFVDLNATSDLNATFPVVKVDYSFTGLHGTAAFHIYGYIKGNGGIQWTNRVEDIGASGFYVTTPAGDSNVLANAQSLPSFNHIYVEVSNKAGASFNDYGNNTYYMKFDNPGGGLNSLHITTDPRNLDGNITTTTSQKGTFYVDFTGGRNQDDFVLLVAVNGTIGSDFSLNLKSSVPT